MLYLAKNDFKILVILPFAFPVYQLTSEQFYDRLRRKDTPMEGIT